MRRVIATLLAVFAAACAGRPAEPAAERRAPRPDIDLPKEFFAVKARVSGGATVASLLRANHIPDGEAAAIVARAASVFDLRKLRSSQPYRLEQTADGRLREFDYEIDADRFLQVRRADAATMLASDRRAEEPTFVAEVRPIEKTRTVEVVRGSIDRESSSLFAAMENAGEGTDLSVHLAEIFGGEIDFNIDVQRGDHFELLVEKQYRPAETGRGEFMGYGPILAAEFTNAGRTLHAVRFTAADGSTAYFDERGVSLRRFFLQSPLKFVPVVTSGFSRNRFHPILREYRAHLGVDYRAPMGSPVVAVADGIVLEAAMKGGSGRIVHLRHANGFESEYLHLSAILVRAGARVHQGDLIGRVGASGLATGPHLDYRLKKNGVFINPQAAHRSMPPGQPVPAPQMTAFEAARDHALSELGARAANQTAPPVTDRQQ